MEKLLTIGIPTYNRQEKLDECLKNIMPQVKGYETDIEVIVSDNASEDGTADVVKKYQDAGDEITYVRNEQNIGSNRNFLSIYRRATGKYIWLFGDDDIMLEGAVKRVIEFISHNREMGLVCLNNTMFRGEFDADEMGKVRMPIQKDICTKDFNMVFRHIGCEITFMTTYLCNRKSFMKMDSPEKYLDTYFVQSYIFAYCMSGRGTYNGIIFEPTVANRTAQPVSYNMYEVFGKRLVDLLAYICETCGYEKRKMQKELLRYWRKVVLMGLIGAKADGRKKNYTNFGLLFFATYKIPGFWLFIYPFCIMPASFYQFSVGIYRRIRDFRNHRKSLSLQS